MKWIWPYEIHEKRDIIEHCTASSSARCIKKRLINNQLWTIWESSEKKEIILFKLASREKNWGYVEITERSGPGFYTCPLSFLEEVEVTNQEWRDKVLEYHRIEKRRKAMLGNIRIGHVVKLHGTTPNEFVVVSTSPLIGKALSNIGTYKGNYRLHRTRIIGVR